MSDITCVVCGKITASLDHICSECSYLIEYEKQFADSDEDGGIVIQTDADLQHFNDMIRAKWRDEHAELIEEWQKQHDESH